jgi:membrane-associated phospholipid phosphatase
MMRQCCISRRWDGLGDGDSFFNCQVEFEMKSLRKLSADRITTTGLIAGLILLTGLTWLGQEVLEQESLPIDEPFLLQIHQWANPVLDQLMLGITRLADPEVVVVVVTIGLGWLVRRRQWRSAVMLLFTCLGTLIINQAMKLTFARPRPLLWPRLIQETSYGFPSGHALGSIVLYGFLAYLLGRRYPAQGRSIYGMAAGLISAIGFSRLYLGVHYPTDILAGYAVGWLWLMLCVFALQRHSGRLNGARINPRDRTLE